MLWHKLIGLAILSLVLTQLGSVQSDVAASGCRNNFSAVAGKCLYASKAYFNWYEGDRVCRSLGAGLLSLQNQTQLEPISQWLNATSTWVSQFWTSGNSLGQKGVYFWQSTGEQATFLPWSPGQPQPADGDCLTFNANSYSSNGFNDFRLNIGNCMLYAHIVCEQTVQNYTYSTRICLKPGSYESAQVLA
ncbi:hypothetical protein ACLKA7_000383 [Drosophila subpalustris]